MSSPAPSADAGAGGTSAGEAAPVGPLLGRGPEVWRFVAILAQLALLLVVFRLFHVETPAFLEAAVIAFAGFGLHYWLPAAWRRWSFAALSIATVFHFFPAAAAATFVGAGLLLSAVVVLSRRHVVRVVVVAAVLAIAAWARATSTLAWQAEAAQLVGSACFFRSMILLYDLRHSEAPPRIDMVLSYFFMLPNWIFLFFPVVDWQTFCKTHERRDRLLIAQDGVRLLVRGTVQLLLYRLVYHLKGRATPDEVTGVIELARALVLTYMLYLRVSGTFHLAIGMLHLFGFDLPETHRGWLLAENLNDFWRRINIYWKDFMVKLFWMPVWFRLRRGGDLRAQLVATAVVFAGTWLLHGCQFFWLMGRFHFTLPDALFWGILGLCVMVNIVAEAGAPRRARAGGFRALAMRCVRIAVTFVFITVLWTLWESSSVAAFLDLLTWWKIGS